MSTAAHPEPGALRFARYALPPHSLGYCGPADPAELTGAARGGDVHAATLLAPAFRAAFPYLRLIAGCAGIADPLDADVVDAYWLGGRLARRVPPAVLASHLAERAGRRARHLVDELRASALAGAPATHTLHVLAMTPFGEMVFGARRSIALDFLEHCRVRSARVLALTGDSAAVSVVPLTVQAEQIVLGPPRVEIARLPLADAASPIAPGDVVALHWERICERLSASAQRALVTSTARTLVALNRARRPLPLLLLEQ